MCTSCATIDCSCYEPALCHGDAWYENILVEESYLHVVGIIDFGNMLMGDPAVDLAPQWYLGEAFYDAVFQEYKKLSPEYETIHFRAMRHLELREVLGLQYTIHNNQVDEYDDAIAKIRNRILQG